MAKSAVTVKGVSQLQGFFLRLAPRVRREVLTITETTGRLMEADAKQRAPVDTGKLRQSITYEPTNGGFGAGLSANVAYWAWVEFGTGGLVEVPPGFEDLAAGYKGKGKRTINRAAQPFLIPAFLKYRDAYYEQISAALDRLLR
ncbi:HK97-gp10 family putative phage morphogenesis protein [Spirosoma sp. 209]|uniref:HK97-gp10 family putative phage morphogenesis protein n=1 Tax=Spirosoma sp. 209 TaxID=1955701 RepID=UPI00098D4BD1|nr:HK97-gp10 family putative phage morphogenesis protein [Spirosoma sp. 209]